VFNEFLPEYAEPYGDSQPKLVDEKASPMNSILAGRKYPLQQRIEDKKRGIGRQKYPFVGMFSRPFPVFVKFGLNCPPQYGL
jgi:hypothetical protein